MRLLVAGGGGFIGSHLADALLARGDEVVAVDNFVTGRESNVAHLVEHPRFHLVRHDVTADFPDDPRLQGPFDGVFNLASPASPNDFATMPLEILAAGSAGTARLLEISRVHGARFLLASTSEVYGEPLVHPQPESYPGNVSSIGPRSCYDEAKRYAEALTMAHHRVYGTDIRIVRIFNTYGPRMAPADGRVVNTFISQALAGEAITLHGDGTQTRSFCEVGDEVSGILRVFDGPWCDGPVNIGNPDEYTMRELADTVVRLCASTSPITCVPSPPEREGDPSRRCPDITLATARLGWTPTVTLEDGLRRMIDHFRTHESESPSAGALNSASPGSTRR